MLNAQKYVLLEKEFTCSASAIFLGALLLLCSLLRGSDARLGWASTHTVLLRLYAVNESVQLSCETCLYSAILDDDAIGKSTEDLMKPEQVLL